MRGRRWIHSPCDGSSSAGDEVHATGGSKTFANVLRDRVRLVGPSASLKFEVKKIKELGKRNIFKQRFEIREGEKLLKSSHCCLKTQAGDVAGLLFISTEKIAFCSQRAITSNIPNESLEETDEKIEIPIRNIRSNNPFEAQQKRIIIITEDGFEFLFTDFLKFGKARQNLQRAIQGR